MTTAHNYFHPKGGLVAEGEYLYTGTYDTNRTRCDSTTARDMNPVGFNYVNPDMDSHYQKLVND